MSAAPNTPRGRETERLMLLWRQQNPDAEASAYNREWTRTYQKLVDHFSDAEIVEMASMNLDALGLEDADRRYLVTTEEPRGTTSPGGFVADTPLKRRREKRFCKANYPATKGAFGKPKHLRRR